MVVVAGLFDSQSSATEAMDRLLRQDIKDLDTHVIEPGGTSDAGSNVSVPVVPNTGGVIGADMRMPGGYAPTGGAAWGAALTWLDDYDENERVFYQEGLREGATLALARVHDEDVEHVRQLFREAGARTYIRD